MLPKRERLTNHEFNNYFKRGKRFSGTYLQLIYSPTKQFHGAVVVGKKVYPKAVDRNRLRRRLYAVLYGLKQNHELKGVYLVLLKPAAKTVSYQLVHDELVLIIGRIHKNTLE